MRWSRIKILTRQKVGLVLLIIGLISFIAAVSLKGYSALKKNSLSFSQLPDPVNVVEEGDLPERIIIAKIGIDLAISSARAVNDQWEISDEGASYLLGTGLPGKEGNVVIYGHNKNHLFGPIRWLGKEEKIKLINRKGEEFVYQIIETKTVGPETVEVLSSTKESRLTLYTCTGFLDQKRFVIVAQLQPEPK